MFKLIDLLRTITSHAHVHIKPDTQNEWLKGSRHQHMKTISKHLLNYDVLYIEAEKNIIKIIVSDET